MEDRDLCARYCRINCLKSSKGAACCTGERAVVHSLGPHHRVACIVRTSTSATGDRAATVSTRVTRDV
jgi:uncharacterized Fe-S radical SAM superfamily protein PflX